MVVLLQSACLESHQTTYRFDSEVNEEQRPVFDAAFREWEGTVGVELVEAGEGEEATINISIDDLPEGFYGWAHYVSETRFINNQYENIDILKTAWITLSPDLWEMDAEVQKRFIVHELAHVFTKAPHSDQCPSTMHAQPKKCGTSYIDEASAEIAFKNINEGWLKQGKVLH